ncbi:MAG: hypothetical protein KBD50_02935 [Candidatus Pacebacteria bacterium]|nr:hypothetical protein [Candidatus Paceibacterota bacterium]
MDAFIVNVLYNPLPIIGAALSFLAVIVFLVFLRGFLSSVLYLFTLNGNDDFLLHSRIRVVWAFLLLVFFFSIWEVVRWIGALLTGGEWPRGIGLATTLLITLFILQWALRFYAKKEKGS